MNRSGWTSRARKGLAVLLGVLALAGAAARSAVAQETQRIGSVPADSVQLVDRVVAVVGDTAVLMSELLEKVISLSQRIRIPPAGTPAFDSLLAQTLNGMTDELVLLERAKNSDIQITKEMLDQESDNRFREIRNSFASPTEFQQAVTRSGRNLVQYRQFLRAQARADMLINSYVEQNRKNLPPVAVSEDEIREFFEQAYAGETRPATISFQQIVLEPQASEAAADSARILAEKALQEIRDGTDFAIVARRYSQDPSNRDQGGDLGWVRRSQLVPAFAEAAWLARTGEPVGPVRTRFGFHIIKVENVRGGERKLRHILIRPGLREDDVERTRQLGEALADSLRAGADIQALADVHGVPEIPVRVVDMPVDEIGTRLGPAYQQALQSSLPGQVIGPFDVTGLVQGKPGIVVLRVTEVKAQGRYELEGPLREQIRSKLLFDKGFQRFLEELRNETYVAIRL
ncbi:MAG: peptidylprolyl isomerase [Gemmatimonadota bacterium]